MSAVRMLYSVALVVILTHLGLGQEGKSANLAPIPSAIPAAQKVFISNAGEDNASDLYSGAQDRCYNDFYRQVRALNRFELVAAPSDADIVLEITMTSSAVPSDVMKGSTVPGAGYESIFRLRLLDPNSQVVLWTFYERVAPAVLKMNRNKNFDNALKQIVTDLSNLTPNRPRP